MAMTTIVIAATLPELSALACSALLWVDVGFSGASLSLLVFGESGVSFLTVAAEVVLLFAVVIVDLSGSFVVTVVDAVDAIV